MGTDERGGGKRAQVSAKEARHSESGRGGDSLAIEPGPSFPKCFHLRDPGVSKWALREVQIGLSRPGDTIHWFQGSYSDGGCSLPLLCLPGLLYPQLLVHPGQVAYRGAPTTERQGGVHAASQRRE